MAPSPRYQLVYSDLLRRLQAGEWKIGEKFPTVDQFEGRYEFSRCTIFKGIQQLVGDGYLEVRKGGQGTFIARTRPVQNIGLLMNESCLQPLKTPYPYVLGEKVAAKLKSEGFSVVRFIERKGGEFSGQVSIDGLADALRSRGIHGMIMANCNFTMFLGQDTFWNEFKVPYAAINTYGHSDFTAEFDYVDFFETALRYLASHARRKIAVIASPDKFPQARTALASFPELQTVSENFLPITHETSPEQSGFETMKRLWRRKERPDALVVTDDIATKGVVQAVLQMGIRIPDELLIIHGANSGTDVFYPIGMPKIEFDLDETVAEAVSLLRYCISNPGAAGRTAMIRPRLLDAGGPGKDSANSDRG